MVWFGAGADGLLQSHSFSFVLGCYGFRFWAAAVYAAVFCLGTTVDLSLNSCDFGLWSVAVFFASAYCGFVFGLL